MPLRYLLPKGSRAGVWYEAHRSAVGFVFLFLCFLGSLAIQEARFSEQAGEIRRTGRQAFAQIERSRVQQSREGCRRTNRKILTVLREQVRQQQADTRRIPAEELTRLGGFTRRELAARYRKRLKRVRPMDCEMLAVRVKRSSPDVPAP